MRLNPRPVLVVAAALAASLVPASAAVAAPPVANSGPSVSVVAGTDAVLAGSVSDPDGDALEIRWLATLVEGGDLSSCTFSGPWGWQPVSAAGLAPTLNCTVPGKYLLQLMVNDGVLVDDDIGALVTFTDPDTTPAACSLQMLPKPPPRLRIADTGSGVASFSVLDTYHLSTKPTTGTFAPPVPSTSLNVYARSGPATLLVSHQNGAGLRAECVLFVRRNGTITVVN